MSDSKDSFPESEKAGVYRAIYQRRDMRHFLPDPLDEALIEKLLSAAHAAPSVGYMQPWRILRIRARATREALHGLVEKERQTTAKALGKRSDEFMQLKVQGILDCGEVWVVSLMEARERHLFGRRTMPQMDLASASCAIQNLWLAARAEGVGVGWVSLFEPEDLRSLLGMPDGADPIAILCIGQVPEFYDQPMLAKEGWAQRGDLNDYVMLDAWDEDKAIRAQQQWETTDE
ncbi:5,6-dimethylbenzimidazole synthase [Pseudomaricurvus alkylphenolicus]|uniref:5,6-dimethylbenzimidazole synthase n=1 Tax=Pseudomaricurvus alkylphenolicus TaxID=1306991 RepID=UPI001422BFD5|nr:5,6-dimethylbenzimidazole synthase [Pseudomaricurvus alkylphenolicus]NIB39977.1 5,6-dimethylbenzimidazole synthase [Pseudomaricurvus alkylphenolicus]